MSEHLAPGKLVLLGEYAVLDGAPAAVCAVDRGVRCTFEAGDALHLFTPGDDRFARAALHAAQAPTGTYRFAAWNPVDTSTKAGFGHSAAATVAALHAAGVRGDALLRLALRVHREVQGGGSGVDVAASAIGGVLRFQDGVCAPLPPIEPLVIWSGTSASTGPRVQAYRAWADASARGDFVQRSAELVDLLGAEPVRALREARRLLLHMSLQARVDWDTPALAWISDVAEELGGAAKPSGAGGGDSAVALFEDDDAARTFADRVSAAGFTLIPTAIAAGVRSTP